MVDEMVASFVGGWESERMDSGQRMGARMSGFVGWLIIRTLTVTFRPNLL